MRSAKASAVASRHDAGHGTLKSYVTGFLLSVILTLAAYLLVTTGALKSWGLVFALVGLAVIQLFVQAIYFLHLASQSKPQWKLLTFGLMIVVVLIIVGGSLWIMYNLDYRMTPKTPQQINQYLHAQTGI